MDSNSRSANSHKSSLFLFEVGNPSSIEGYQGLNMDPDSSNYIVKVIGDQFSTVNNDGEITTYGDYPNLSPRIRVGDYKEDVFRSNKSMQPMGYAAVNNPITAGSAALVPSSSFNRAQTLDGGSTSASPYKSELPYGFKIHPDFNDHEIATNLEYLSPVPYPVATGNNAAFNLENMYGYGTTSDSEYSRYTNFAVSASGLSISSSILSTFLVWTSV